MNIVVYYVTYLAMTLIGMTSSMTVMDYAKEYGDGMDREYTPITGLKCRFSPRHRRMKACQIYMDDPAKLKMYSDQYLTYGINYWGKYHDLAAKTEVKEEGDRTTSTVSNYVRFYHPYRSTSRYRSYDDDDDDKKRKRRDVSQDGGSPTSSPKHLRRVKRGTKSQGVNPCAEKKSRKTIVIHGIDAINGEIVELLQDPDKNMFQTYYTKRCMRRTFYNMRCEPQYVKFETAVFIKGTLNVHVRPVQIPTNCALSF